MINWSRGILTPILNASVLAPLNVVQVRALQVSNSAWSYRIGDVPALAHTARRIGFYQTGIGQGVQMPVQARPAYLQHGLELADSRRTKNGQLAQDVGLSPAAHECHCGFDVWGQVRSDQSGHASILPDFRSKDHESYGVALLLNKRVCVRAFSTWSRVDAYPPRPGLITDASIFATPYRGTKIEAEGFGFAGQDEERP